MAQVQDQLREVVSSNLEFTSAVDSLQREVKRLEIRVEDLDLQLQNVNQGWNDHNTDDGQGEPDPLNDWYDSPDVQVEASESVLLLAVTPGSR